MKGLRTHFILRQWPAVGEAQVDIEEAQVDIEEARHSMLSLS